MRSRLHSSHCPPGSETIVVLPLVEIDVRTPTPIVDRLRVETVAIKASGAATKVPVAATSGDSNPATQPPPQRQRAAATSAAPVGPTTPAGQRIVVMTAARVRTLLRLQTVDLRSVPVIRPLAGDSQGG